ncbi:LPXTG cell wall anchor domain-containing protein [Erysipelothrix aquatica]|uniref:LPXTG cell wall anchor domain-containing protein n=1 Tax=Erysipelothrix aquatica TaxID=2683714 RepID=UPI0039EF037E
MDPIIPITPVEPEVVKPEEVETLPNTGIANKSFQAAGAFLILGGFALFVTNRRNKQ